MSTSFVTEDRKAQKAEVQSSVSHEDGKYKVKLWLTVAVPNREIGKCKLWRS